jgi:hypothetical protein
MQTTRRNRINLRNPGDLIAAIPYLLGFHPTESVVLCVHAGTDGSEVNVCVRVDLPPPELYWDLAEQLTIPVLRANAGSVTLIIVGEQGEPPQPLPHLAQVQAIITEFACVGVPVTHALWTSEVTKGANWWCYDNMECSGRLPDPSITELAVAITADGSVTYESRDTMRAAFEPEDSKPLARRAERIARALGQSPDETHARKLMEDAFTDVRDGTFTLDDDRVVDLAVALSHTGIRDACLRPEIVDLGPVIESMWFELTRAMPPPYRAEPAGLLAVTAFLRGDGALAGVAIEVALEADPDHAVSRLLRSAMDFGLAPEELTEAISAGLAQSASTEGET